MKQAAPRVLTCPTCPGDRVGLAATITPAGVTMRVHCLACGSQISHAGRKLRRVAIEALAAWNEIPRRYVA